MVELNPFQIVNTDGYAPLYKKDYPYSYLCLQSNIHPNCYDDISLDDLKRYFNKRFKLSLDVSKFDDKWSVYLVRNNNNDEIRWIWGQRFDDLEEAWMYGALKTIQVIHEYNLPINE
mgnify:FL=1